MVSHSAFLLSMRKMISQISKWYECSNLHHMFRQLAKNWDRSWEHAKLKRLIGQFFNRLSYSKIYELLEIIFAKLTDLIYHGNEKLAKHNSSSVLLKTVNNFSTKEGSKQSFALVGMGFGLGLLIKFILNGQLIRIPGLAAFLLLVFILLTKSHKKNYFKGSLVYKIVIHGLPLIDLDEEEV